MTILFCFFISGRRPHKRLDGASMPPRGLVEHFEEGFDPDLELFGIRLRVVRHDLLALVRAIAEFHGGAVYVEKSRGAGSRFVLKLPCEKDPPPD